MANRIPQYGEPQVQERPLGIPNVPTDQPLSAFGGGQAAEDVTRQAVGLAGDIERDQQRRYQEQYQHGVNLQALEISNQLTAEATRAKNELSQRQGKSALGGREQTLSGYDKFYQGIEKNLTNDDVKRVAYAHYLQHKEGLDAFATPYEAGQLKEYDNNELLASMKVQQESAAADPTPANVSVASMSQKLALEEFAQRNGYGNAWLEEKQQTAGSATHLSALRSLAAGKQYAAAKDFYENNAQEFVGDDVRAAKAIVQQTTTLGDAYTLSDAVMAKKPATIGEAMAQLDGMTKNADPETRHHAEQLLTRRYEIEKAAQKEVMDQTFQEASKLINQPENYGKLPWEVIDPATWLALPDNDRKALIASSYALMKPIKEGDDYQGVTQWHAMSNDQIAQMSPGDMERWREKLTRTNFDKFAEQWGKIRKGEDDLSLKTTHEDRQYFFTSAKNDGRFGFSGLDTLENIGHKSNVEKSKAFEGAFSDIKNIMDAEQKTKGKKLTQLEREEIVNKYILSKPKPAGFLDSVGRIFLPYNDKYGLTGRERVAPMAPLSDLEKRDINSLIKKATGKDGSDEKIMKLKRAQSAGASINDIIKMAQE